MTPAQTQQPTLYPVGVNDSIRAAVRAEIKKTGLSQAEVARQMGLEPQELNRALQGRGKIPPVWLTILNHFGLTIVAVADDTPEKKTSD